MLGSYKRINQRLETLQKQMTIIQYEAQGLIEELEDLRKKENKTINDGKK
jgi:septation ring formation regulator EzrA